MSASRAFPAHPTEHSQPSSSGRGWDGSVITQFTNCRLLRHGNLMWGDLWINTNTGLIIEYPGIPAARIIDLGGCILAPGFIDCQLNGAFGFNFSTIMDDMSEYAGLLDTVNAKLVQTGVTSYLPTLTSQQNEVYHKAIPFLAPKPHRTLGSSSLGAHLEGPFLNSDKCGVHDVSVLRVAESFHDIESVYNIDKIPAGCIKMVTLAPEVVLPGSQIIEKLKHAGIVVSLGHTKASYDVALKAVRSGASMVTHLFNAMPPIGHREAELTISNIIIPVPGTPLPYFGIIADGIHTHPSAVVLAHSVHPNGLILVTDAMHVLGLPDGTFPWRNGTQSQSSITKTGWRVTKTNVAKNGEKKEVLAGSAVTLLECVNNFIGCIDRHDLSATMTRQQWISNLIAMALRAVTETPADMLGLGHKIGYLEAGRNADLVILQDVATPSGGVGLTLKSVWKHGAMVHTS
ncbi:hypothetical protein B0T21DRAFT_283848 [Apiosordaria backusii]|uniref:Amidohydrolase-related domain-containing protein n=1 Tax=Apiosordaria backusii TaxID=314023 RepID=A0AA40ENE6_9PEZI|nr:hypothetical protein B0T21DRAFT_283848 [Apiosordaria backusii]